MTDQAPRSRAGFIVPSVNSVIEDDLRRMMPWSVGCCTARASLGRGSREDVLAFRDKALEAVPSLLDAHVDLVVFACTAASMIGGPDYDAAVVRDLHQAGAPAALTTAGAMVSALRCLGARAISFISPVNPVLHDWEARFFKDVGFSVGTSERMNLGHPNDLAAVEPTSLVAEIRRLLPLGRPVGDAIVLSCANMRALEAVPLLEADFGAPLVTSNQAMIWAVLRQLDPGRRAPGLGRLSDAS